ncbi:RNA-directed DNA polymerase [Vibrio splendidus]|nr:RNA-directed DNA polymerase [Vibrio splendidus]PTO61972.1 RNA-directed DNA polymerase [Vibrio splendidus]
MNRKSKLRINTKCKSYQLQDSSFYKLTSKKRLASILNLSLQNINSLRCDLGNYTEFEELGKSGKPRKIQKPCHRLDVAHTRIASLLCRIQTPTYLHSGKKSHSNVTNAASHVNFHQLLATDVKSFFPSTSRKMVFSFFLTVLKCSPDIADILADICTCHNHIPTGSRISMPLAYWANCRMFEELERVSDKHHVTMTVYVDDLTFSGEKVNRQFRSLVKKIISKHGHTMHPKKTKLYQGSQPKLVTGVIVSDGVLKVRNEQHLMYSSELAQWDSIKNLPLASETNLVAKLIGRLHSMGVIDTKYKAKVKSIKNATCSD